MTFDDKENFEKVAQRVAENIDNQELYSKAKSLQLSLSLDYPLECFAVIAFLNTRELVYAARKTFIKKDLVEKLEKIEKMAGDLGDLINSLPKGSREWFGDTLEKWGDENNPAALQCFQFAATARFVKRDFSELQDGYYNVFLRQFLEYYFMALRSFRAETKEEFEEYLDFKWSSDKSELSRIFAQVVSLGFAGRQFLIDATHEVLKARRKSFDNNHQPIVVKLKKEALQNWRNN